jgi:hypothetical protein
LAACFVFFFQNPNRALSFYTMTFVAIGVLTSLAAQTCVAALVGEWTTDQVTEMGGASSHVDLTISSTMVCFPTHPRIYRHGIK